MTDGPERTAGPYAWLPAVVGFLALAGVAIGWVGLATLRDRLIESAGRTLALTAAESVGKLDLILGEHATRLRILARDPALALDDEVRVTARLKAFTDDYAEYRWVGITDLSGHLMAASDPNRVGTTVGSTAWIAIARDVGLDVRTVRTPNAPGRGTPALAFSVPLTDAHGNVRGALIAHTGLAHVKRVFNRSARALHRKWGGAITVDWHLVSPNGDLIASTNRRPMLGKLALPSAFASAAAAPGYLEEREPTRDVAMLTGYARMQVRKFPTLPRWALLLHVDQRDVVGPIRTTIAKLGALWALVAAPLFLVTIWATARLRGEWSESRDESHRALAARRAADESEARMRAVLDHAAEGIVTVGADGKIQSFNAAAVRMFGWAPEEVCGSSIARLLPSGATGRHDHTVARWLTRAVTRQRGRSLEVIGRRRNGSAFPLGLALSQVATGDQRVFIGIVRDLSEQKRAESDRGLLASIIEHTDDFVWLSSMDGRVVFVNPAGRRLVGLSALAAVGDLSFDDFIFPDDRARFRELIVPTVLREGRWQGELAGRHVVTGEALAVAVNLFLVHHAQSARPTGFAAVCRDLREQKRVEEETRRGQELRLAKDLAESATVAKSEFLATMSHEIRTPLNGVVGMTALLLETRLNEEQRDYAESLRTCSASLLSVIDDVLDFSKMEAGKLQIEIIDFDLRRTVEEVVELFAERAHSKGIELAALIEPTTPTALRGDPNRLRQILANLISNALKFTERGEVVVRAAAVGDAPGHTVLHLEVADTGIGIAPERQAMIFESFSQSDVANARLYGGSGLGLAIVKRLSELMGGQIVVDSEAGAGSTFTLVIRLEKQPNAAAATSPALLRGRRVLVVDDSPTIRALLGSYLRALGIRCGGTEDGAHALALLRAAATRHKPYDVVLVDWEMPIMDGLELTRAIRAEPAIARVPVVLLTGIGQRGSVQRAGRRAGVAAMLSKPIRAARLQTCLTNLLVPASARRLQRHEDAGREARRLPLAGHVLVAEDDPTSQKVIARLLEKRGHRVDVAGDGRAAVEACQRRAYDLVLMDCRLPELDGFQATREIRRREAAGRRTPIIALTASTAPELRDRCLEAGMDDQIGKPIRVEELDTLLQRWIAPTHRAAEPQAREPAVPDDDVLDVAGLLDRVEGDVAFVRELADGLAHDGPRWLADLRTAFTAGDRTTLEQTAHAVRGSVSNLGGHAAAMLAERIESRARNCSLAEGPDACAELERALARLHRALLALGDDQLAAS